jgi:hypothetical protein
MKRFLPSLLLALGLGFAAVNPAYADLASEASTQIAAAQSSVETYGKAILSVLVVIAIAVILFGMTKKAH